MTNAFISGTTENQLGRVKTNQSIFKTKPQHTLTAKNNTVNSLGPTHINKNISKFLIYL